MSVEVVPQMTTEEARACVIRIRAHLDGARAELLRLYEAEGWRALGHESWRACVVAEFGQSQAYLYRQLAAAQIEARVSPIGENGPIPESHLRPLSALDEEDQAEAWQEATATAPNGQLTAAHVAAVVEQFRQPDRMAALFSSESPEWYTPAHVIAAVVDFFDAIDLDPCAEETEPKTVPAAQHFTVADDGLIGDWWGRVYLNPPYGEEIGRWVAKLDAQYLSGNIEAGIALVPARTDTDWFAPLWAFPICFIHGRLKFDGPNGKGNSAGFPSALVYLGDEYERFAATVAHLGPVVRRYDTEAS